MSRLAIIHILMFFVFSVGAKSFAASESAEARNAQVEFDAKQRLVDNCVQQGNLEEAETVCAERVKKFEKQPHYLVLAFCSLGDIQTEREKYKDAEDSYQKAKEIASNGDKYLPDMNLGFLRLKENRSSDAVALWEHILAPAKGSNFDVPAFATEIAIDGLRMAYEDQGMDDAKISAKVDQLYRNAISSYEGNDKFHEENVAVVSSEYATFLSGRNRFSEAEPLFKHAFSVFQRYGEISKFAKWRKGYADLLRQSNKVEEARKVEAVQ